VPDQVTMEDEALFRARSPQELRDVGGRVRPGVGLSVPD
jgi:hypothetical protein